MVEFRLLGAVEAYHDGRQVKLGPRKQRLTLGVLALEANRPVAVDRLVALNWPSSPPRTAEHAVRVSVSQLRSILGTVDPTRSEAELIAQGAGYVLRTDPRRIDVHRFRDLVQQARDASDDERRLDLLNQALTLRRGPLLAGTAPQETQERLGRGLEETWLVALEDKVDAELRLGRHRRLLDELTELAATHPFRERLTCQLMIALYRSGQPHIALETARRVRGLLADELGIDPGLELQRLEVAILRNDPALLPPPDRVAVSAPPAMVPAQLPPTVTDFTGRAGELRWLDELIHDHAPGPVTIAITGPAGAGKTALAVYWAHRIRDRFPDGQLYVDLRGYAPGPALPPAQALARFLRSLGVSPEHVPTDLDEATALYRTLLADKRVLVVLDNATSPEQVRPLLPGADRCLVVTTSRDRLSGLVALEGARDLPLGVLDPGEARALLARILGAGRLVPEPDAAARLAQLCDYLPLALRIAATNLSRRPDRTISAAVSELADGNRLNALRVDGDDQAAVRAAFDLSYAALEPAAQRLFHLIGVSPCPDVTPEAAAALADAPLEQVRQNLDRLERAHLVHRHVAGRYGFHDLLRLYARDCADDPADCDQALERLYAFYLGAVGEAGRLLYPRTPRLPSPRPTAAPVAFRDPEEALAWLDAERPSLVAAITYAAEHGPHHAAWRLADALRGYLSLRRDPIDWLTIAEAARQAARRDGDLAAQAACELSLAQVHQARSDHRSSRDHYTQALLLAQEAGWREGEAAVLNNLGNVHWKLGTLQRAAGYYSRAIAISMETGQQIVQATSTANLSMVYRSMGELRRAMAYQHQALGLSRKAGYRNGEAIALENLGEICLDLGEFDRALDFLGSALPMFRQAGNRYGEVLALDTLAAVQRDAGDHERALEWADSAVELAVALGDRRAESDTLNTRGAVHTRLGQPELAVEQHTRALAIAREIANLQPTLDALIGLALAHWQLGNLAEASACGCQALDAARRQGFTLLEHQALGILAAVHLTQENIPLGMNRAREALKGHRRSGHRLGQARTMEILRKAFPEMVAAELSE